MSPICSQWSSRWSQSHPGISAYLCSGRDHSWFPNLWCSLVPAVHPVPANGALGLNHCCVRRSCLSSAGGALSLQVWYECPPPQFWILLSHLAPEAAPRSLRTECPQLLIYPLLLPTLTSLPTQGDSIAPFPPHYILPSIPALGWGWLKTRPSNWPGTCQHYLLPPWSSSSHFPSEASEPHPHSLIPSG